MRRITVLLACLVSVALVVAGLGYRSALSDPVVRRAAVSLADWPAGASPVTIALVSDGLVLAGHKHCGQTMLPLYGPPLSVSRYGECYRCGLVREGARTTIVTAGVGTSVLPLRWRAPPDLWLIRVGP